MNRKQNPNSNFLRYRINIFYGNPIQKENIIHGLFLLLVKVLSIFPKNDFHFFHFSKRNFWGINCNMAENLAMPQRTDCFSSNLDSSTF